MADLERIFTAYQKGLKQLNHDVVSRLGPSDDEREHLVLLGRLLEDLALSYATHHLQRTRVLEANTSIMYAASVSGDSDTVLDVSLRNLVDSSTLSTWQARLIHGHLNARRTIIISGVPGTGKSTLLNSLVSLIPVDQRMIVIEETSELPSLKDRSFTVHLPAKQGAAAAAMRKAPELHPTWILVGSLQQDDWRVFLESLAQGFAGLATLDTPDPEVTLHDWITTSTALAGQLSAVSPLLVHMDRDAMGRPRVLRLFEATADSSGLRLTEQSES